MAGDWHGNTRWARDVIQQAGSLLAAETGRTILHLGDFGVWPSGSGNAYLFGVEAALRRAAIRLCFVDGNHEAHDRLDALHQEIPGKPVHVTPRIWHLPRGYRWQWHGRTWLACGGGVSLDKVIRTEGVDWWPQEEITAGQ